MSLPRYSEYRDSEVDWLGDVPTHWAVNRLKTHVSLVTEKATQRTRPVALENIEGWSGRFISTEGEFEGEGVGFWQGDVLFGKLRPYLAKAYLAESPGEAVGDFHVLRPSRHLNARFLQYQILSRSFIDIIDGSTFGSKMPRASWDALGGMPLAMPPLEEQSAIAAFLDRETAKIDALIAEQEKLIALLAEKRQATISHAVTKGLNPDAPMKDSGVPWLGEVPAHWEVLPLKRFLSFLTSGSRGWAEHYSDDGAIFLRIGNLTRDGVELDLSDIQRVSPPEGAEGSRTRVEPGDVLFSITAFLGSVATVPEGFAEAYVSQHVALARLIPDGLQPRWVAYTTLSDLGVTYLASQGYGGTKIQLSLDDIRNLPVTVPPPHEQQATLQFLDSELTKLRDLRCEAEHAVALLRNLWPTDR
jgi:type I restriction enzyme S subunit